tara:strand:+ start:131 stop:1126 length:996 start_codon:yes stop_codon:yes gene_type:complete
LAFSDQVEALTGITISASGTNPTNDQLSQYLVDGTKDVINKMIVARPEEINKFTATTHDANDSGITVTGKVVSVVREHDSTSILRQCTPISAGLRYEATDADSLNYRSAYNPGYYTLNGKVHTVPISAGSDNDAIVTQVTYAVNQGHSSSSIDTFPDEYEYLVVLYAAVKSINNNMAAIIADLSSFTLKTVPPDLPVTAKSIPTYDDPDNNDAGGRSVSDEIDQMLTYIETNEDVELANAKASEVGLRFKRALDQFGSDMQAYQAENQGEIAHYSAEIQAYTAEVTAEVQDQTAKVQTETAKYTWLQDRGASLQAEYIAAFATPQPQGGGR